VDYVIHSCFGSSETGSATHRVQAWKIESKKKAERGGGRKRTKMESRRKKVIKRLLRGNAYISISPAFRLAAFPFAAALRRLDAGPLVLAFLAEWTD